MKTKIVYRCTSYTEAIEASNLYYISCNAANKIERNTADKQIKVFGKKGLMAVFIF